MICVPNPLHARMQSRFWVLERINLGFEAIATMSLAPLWKSHLTSRRAVLKAALEPADALYLRTQT